MKVLTGAGAILSAAHRDRNGHLHGHTWEVTAWWAGKPDAVERQKALNDFLWVFDHEALPNSLALAEDLAAHIMEELGCVRVEISRPLERLYAIVEAA